jgi:glycosyltransferase involved in cell wall biosynthesis
VNILILNQAFYPDVVSTAQHASDLAVALVRRGHKVTVLCSSRGYDDSDVHFPYRENWHGINIVRVHSTGFGKSAKWRRAADFATFISAAIWRLLMLSKFDVVVAMTSPPLISFIAAIAVPIKARRLIFWSMDLNPDEAIAAGWLTEKSILTKFLSGMLLFSLRRADQIIALDTFMKQRIEEKGINREKISIVPPWSHDDHVRFDEVGRQQFRTTHGLDEKFVVMYSGNHSPCHPLDTLLDAAARLSGKTNIVFCFIGGGSEFRKVQAFARENRLVSVLTLPYQPLGVLSASLSAADMQVVVMGDFYVGIVHPCKIYNILAANRDVLYIGPEKSHVAEIIGDGGITAYSCRTGDADAVASSILHAAAQIAVRPGCMLKSAQRFSKTRLLPQIVSILERDSNPAHELKAHMPTNTEAKG